jgi:hypothetical protein
MTGKKLVSVVEAVVTGERVTSPRSLEACRRMGIDASELLPRYASPSLPLTTFRSLTQRVGRHAGRSETSWTGP